MLIVPYSDYFGATAGGDGPTSCARSTFSYVIGFDNTAIGNGTVIATAFDPLLGGETGDGRKRPSARRRGRTREQQQHGHPRLLLHGNQLQQHGYRGSNRPQPNWGTAIGFNVKLGRDHDSDRRRATTSPTTLLAQSVLASVNVIKDADRGQRDFDRQQPKHRRRAA